MKLIQIGIFLIALSLLTFSVAFGSESPVSPDAVAIRVMPNLNHYSPIRWYNSQGFSGQPNQIIIDGYEAVQDGNTIYVNAANIVGLNFYTNIYVIAFNVGAENLTNEIFLNILSNIKFNSDITALGSCSLNTDTSCTLSSDCPSGDYCMSEKAKIVRDTRRLSDLAEIKIALDAYRGRHGKDPELLAGTYLPGKSISVWPSWQQTLAPMLGVADLPKDPINKLGICPAEYDSDTCWDEVNKVFYDPKPDNNLLDLPENSLIYMFTSK